MPFIEESVLFREKDGGYGGDPTWMAAIVLVRSG